MLTFFVVQVVYTLFDDLSGFFQKKRKVGSKKEGENPKFAGTPESGQPGTTGAARE